MFSTITTNLFILSVQIVYRLILVDHRMIQNMHLVVWNSVYSFTSPSTSTEITVRYYSFYEDTGYFSSRMLLQLNVSKVHNLSVHPCFDFRETDNFPWCSFWNLDFGAHTYTYIVTQNRIACTKYPFISCSSVQFPNGTFEQVIQCCPFDTFI